MQRLGSEVSADTLSFTINEAQDRSTTEISNTQLHSYTDRDMETLLALKIPYRQLLVVHHLLLVHDGSHRDVGVKVCHLEQLNHHFNIILSTMELPDQTRIVLKDRLSPAEEIKTFCNRGYRSMKSHPNHLDRLLQCGETAARDLKETCRKYVFHCLDYPDLQYEGPLTGAIYLYAKKDEARMLADMGYKPCTA
jgi:hypothetical protein